MILNAHLKIFSDGFKRESTLCIFSLVCCHSLKHKNRHVGKHFWISRSSDWIKMASILILVRIILKCTDCFPRFLSGYSHHGQPWEGQVQSSGLSQGWRQSGCSTPWRPALLGKLYQGRGWTRQVTEGHSHPSWCPLSSPHLCCSLGTGSFLHHPLSSTSLPSVVANGCSPQAHSPDAATPSPSCLALLFSLTSHANPHLAGKTIEQNLAFSRPRCSVRTSSISLSINQK